jgi:3-hydroxyacyl-[acyl-carrier-protein] dehydratase
MTVENRKLRLASAAIQCLLPHRRPMLFVDFVAAYERAPRPSLLAGRHISSNDTTFAGHFPQLPIWPGIYTVEGMNQTCNLLGQISALQERWEAAGGDPTEVLDALRNIDRSYQLRAAVRASTSAPLLEMLEGAGSSVGLSAGIDVRFTAPVFGGCQLDYSAVEIHADEAIVRYEVEALVDGCTVAKGKLTLSRGAITTAFEMRPLAAVTTGLLKGGRQLGFARNENG